MEALAKNQKSLVEVETSAVAVVSLGYPYIFIMTLEKKNTKPPVDNV